MSLLCFDHVRKAFASPRCRDGDLPVLESVNLDLAPGEVIALVGKSGAGKTTLLHLAAGLLRPSAGRIFFDGQSLQRRSQRDLGRLRRTRIGLVFQNNLSLTVLPVWENAALPLLLEGVPRRMARRRADQILERVGLGRFGEASTRHLSGGQRRRLRLARALISEPQLLLADEPTADLDEQTSDQIKRLLFDWLDETGRGALIVTHDLPIERFAHRLVCLDAGRLYPAEVTGTARPCESS